jgi:hypothetical protein
MGISYKVRNPKTVEDLQKNVEDLARDGMNKGALKGLRTTDAAAGGAYDQGEQQKIIDKLNEVISKLNNT